MVRTSASFIHLYVYSIHVFAGAIGKVLHMEGSLGLDIELLPDGAGLDLGIYPLNLARLVFDREEPEEIIVRGSKCPSGEYD